MLKMLFLHLAEDSKLREIGAETWTAKMFLINFEVSYYIFSGELV